MSIVVVANNGNDTHDDEDNNCLGKAGDADCNRGDSKGEVVDSGVSGVNNKSADEIPELEIVHGVLGKLYANSGSDNNDLLLNGDKGFLDSSSGGDSDRGVHDGNDDGLNSDGKVLSNGILGGSSENEVVDLSVIAALFLGRPGGLCIRACCFFSRFLCCLPINNFLFPMTADANTLITQEPCILW